MLIREFFSEGKFMVMECQWCGCRQILDVSKEITTPIVHTRIFLRNRLYEYMEKLKREKMEVVACMKSQ